MLSGIFLAFHYRPFGNVFQNVEEITTVIPYGFFFRRLHYVSGQVFAILTLFHVADYFLRRRYHAYSLQKWLLLTSPVYISFFLLFTGFLLKGDKEGLLAGNILLNITRDIPFIGNSISNLLIRPGESFYFLPYLHHCLFLPPVLVFLLYDHIRAWLPKLKFMILTTSILFAYSLFVKMPLDIPPQAEFSPVKGPWFFLGIQESLRIIPPLIGGIVFPFSFVLVFSLLAVTKGFWETLIRYFVVISSVMYGILIVVAYFFMEYSWGIF